MGRGQRQPIPVAGTFSQTHPVLAPCEQSYLRAGRVATSMVVRRATTRGSEHTVRESVRFAATHRSTSHKQPRRDSTAHQDRTTSAHQKRASIEWDLGGGGKYARWFRRPLTDVVV